MISATITYGAGNPRVALTPADREALDVEPGDGLIVTCGDDVILAIVDEGGAVLLARPSERVLRCRVKATGRRLVAIPLSRRTGT